MSLIITIRPTSIIAPINGAPARLWAGRTLNGGKAYVWVACVVTADEESDGEVKASLGSTHKPPAGLSQETMDSIEAILKATGQGAN